MGFTREIHQEDILKMINTKALRFVYEMAEIGWFHKKRNEIKYACSRAFEIKKWEKMTIFSLFL